MVDACVAGRECQRLYEELSSERPKFAEPAELPPPTVVPPPRVAPSTPSSGPLPPPASDYGYTNSHSDYGSSSSYRSNPSTPMSYDSGYSYCSSSQFGGPHPSSWEVNHCGTSWPSPDGLWGGHANPWDATTEPIPSRKPSPPRESLDSRIELLLKQTEGGFLDVAAVPPFGSPPTCDASPVSALGRLSLLPESTESQPPLPPDTSPLPPLPEQDEPPPPPPEEEDGAEEGDGSLDLLSTPPSPFLSQREYHWWAAVTRDTKVGREVGGLLLTSDSEPEDRRVTGMAADVGPTMDDTNLSVPSTRDSTPVHDELPEPPEDGMSLDGTRPMGNMKEDEDDDRMSLSSLSSGEEKLQVNAPPPGPPPSAYVAQETAPYPTSSLYSGATASGYPGAAHPMYPSQEVQMMAQMGIWKPGMGSGVQGSPTGHQTAPPGVSPGSSGTSYAYAGTPLPPMLPAYNPNYPPPPLPHYPSTHTLPSHHRPSQPLPQHYPTSYYPPGTTTPPQYSRDYGRAPPPSPYRWYGAQVRPPTSPQGPPGTWSSDPNAPTVRAVLDALVLELKEIVKRDICKRMVESYAFKRFEAWWDEQVSAATKVNPLPQLCTSPDTVSTTQMHVDILGA